MFPISSSLRRSLTAALSTGVVVAGSLTAAGSASAGNLPSAAHADSSVRSLGPGNPPNPNFLKSPAQVAITPDAGHVLVNHQKGALSPEQRARFDAHLQACDACTNYVEQMTRTLHVTGTIDQQTLSSTAEAALLTAFRDWHATDEPTGSR